MADFPKSKDWKDLKKLYGIPNGAVKGIEVGKALDEFHQAYDSVSGLTASKKRVPIAQELENTLAAYLSKLQAKKSTIKKYDAFEKVFLDKYVGRIHFLKEDLKRYSADSTLYTAELAKFFHDVHQLEPHRATVTRDDLHKFNSGPMRGLSALGKGVQKVDPREIDKALGPINKAIDALPATPDRETLDKLMGALLKAADEGFQCLEGRLSLL